MKYFKFILSTSLLLFLFGTTHAQSESTTHDFIILPSGSKEFGKIESKFDLQDYPFIRFTNVSGTTKEYTADELQGFGLANGRVFVSKPALTTNSQAFYQLLLQGKLSLLSLEELFYVDNGEELILLPKADKKELSNSRTFSISRKYPHIAILNILTSGKCGIKIQELIASTKYYEQDFLDVLTKYHTCENLPYDIVIDRVPKKIISPYVMVGLGQSEQLLNFRNAERTDAFVTGVSPTFIVGIKGHQIRNRPKFGYDIGLGVAFQEYQINTVQTHSSRQISGTQEFRSINLVLPAFLNYTLTKNQSMELYVGVGTWLGYSFLQEDFAVMDHRQSFSSIITLKEESFVDRKRVITNPAFKIGSHFKPTGKIGILLEYQATYSPQNFSIPIEDKTSVFSEINNTLLIGIRF
ncbi:MAG: hypothetical protein ACXIUQ_13925 [Cecembia sp.]